MNRLLGRFVLFSVLTLTPAAAYAQASIAGTVRDASGAVLPGVTVEASSPALIEKVRSVITDGTGQYQIIDLRPGTYTVTFTLTGFNTVRREGIELNGSFVASVSVDLRVGSLEETITVRGEAPVVDVKSVAQQRVFDHDVIDVIPSGRQHNSLAVLIPGVTTSAQDVGGTNVAGTSVNMAIHGSRNGDFRVAMDGLSIASTEGTGQFSGMIPNMSGAAEITVDTSGASAEAGQSGVRINLIPREGGNAFQGTFFGARVDTKWHLVGNNYTEELKARGLTAPNALQSAYDANPAFGGPVMRDKLWFFAAFRWQAYDATIPRYYNLNAFKPEMWLYEPDLSRQAHNGSYYHSFNNRFTWQIDARNKIGLFYDDSSRCGCPAYNVNTSPEGGAANNGFPAQRYAQATWSSPWTNRLLLEAGFSNRGEGWHTGYSTDYPNQKAYIPVTEQSTGLIYHGKGTSLNGGPFNHFFDQTWVARASVSYVTGSHAWKIGLQDVWGSRDFTIEGSDTGLSYRFNNGQPNQITMAATSYVLRGRQKADLGVYAQDKWTLKQLTLNLGVRYDYFNTYFAETTVGPGPLVPNRNLTLPETPFLNWKDVTPRLGVAYDLFGDGRTAIKATLGRYVVAGGLQGVLGDNGAPISQYANLVTRVWTDGNRNFTPDCDLLNPLANGECGAMSDQNFGKPVATSTRYDPAVLNGWGVRAYSWEYSTSIQHELLPRLSVNVGYFRRWYGNFTMTDNQAVAPSDLSPFQITAPVDSRLPNGGGNTITGLYDLNPNKVGQINNLFTAAGNYGKQIEHWNGVDFSANARIGGGIVASGGFSTGRTVTDNCEVLAKVPEIAPLGGPYCHQSTGFVTQVKGLAAYTVPRIDVQISGTFQSLAGPVIAANYVAANAAIQPSLGRPLSQGANATINLVAPGTMYGDRLNQLDLRFGKLFRLGGRTRAAINLDLFNALNATPVLTENANFATWRVPQTILAARFAKINVQLDF